MRFIVVDKREGNQPANKDVHPIPQKQPELKRGQHEETTLHSQIDPWWKYHSQSTNDKACETGISPVNPGHAHQNRAHTSTSVPKTTQLTTCDAVHGGSAFCLCVDFHERGSYWEDPFCISPICFLLFSWSPGQATLCLCRHFCLAGIHAPKRLEKPVSPPPTCKGCSGQWKPWTRGSCFVGSQSCSLWNFILRLRYVLESSNFDKAMEPWFYSATTWWFSWDVLKGRKADMFSSDTGKLL